MSEEFMNSIIRIQQKTKQTTIADTGSEMLQVNMPQFCTENEKQGIPW